MYSEVLTICVTNLARLGERIVSVDGMLLRVRALIESYDPLGLSHSPGSGSEFPSQSFLLLMLESLLVLKSECES